uniref:Uncharacterized protein n=1 Tax=Megaselia scalaris TaxID=36166 RepID=T1GN57_MEGSC
MALSLADKRIVKQTKFSSLVLFNVLTKVRSFTLCGSVFGSENFSTQNQVENSSFSFYEDPLLNPKSICLENLLSPNPRDLFLW